MNIMDREDDKIVITALVEHYSKLKSEADRIVRQRGAVEDPLGDRELADLHNMMERINNMLTRWVSPEK